GWQYADWRNVLYPAGVPQRLWLECYAGQYATVENNGAFYRLPSPQTFAGWRARTPDGFVMAVKASRYLTHIRRLRDPAEPAQRRLGLPALSRGRRAAVAALRPAGPAQLGGPRGRRLAGRPGRVRLLQQRSARRGRA